MTQIIQLSKKPLGRTTNLFTAQFFCARLYCLSQPIQICCRTITNMQMELRCVHLYCTALPITHTDWKFPLIFKYHSCALKSYSKLRDELGNFLLHQNSTLTPALSVWLWLLAMVYVPYKLKNVGCNIYNTSTQNRKLRVGIVYDIKIKSIDLIKMISFIKPCLQRSWTRPLIDQRIVLFPVTHYRCLLQNWFIGIFICNQAIATQNLFFHFAPPLFRSFGNIYSYIVSTQITFYHSELSDKARTS